MYVYDIGGTYVYDIYGNRNRYTWILDYEFNVQL